MSETYAHNICDPTGDLTVRVTRNCSSQKEIVAAIPRCSVRVDSCRALVAKCQKEAARRVTARRSGSRGPSRSQRTPSPPKREMAHLQNVIDCLLSRIPRNHQWHHKNLNSPCLCCSCRKPSRWRKFFERDHSG